MAALTTSFWCCRARTLNIVDSLRGVPYKKSGEKASRALEKKFTHPVDVSPGAAHACLRYGAMGENVVRGTRGELICRTCHKPHHSHDTQFLLAEHKGKRLLCLECHVAQAAVSGTSHDMRLTAPREENILKNSAAAGGPCDPCHLVHSGTAEHMWARRLIPDRKDVDALAAAVTHPAGALKKKQCRDSSHPMHIGMPETKTSAGLPLFDAGGREAQRETLSA